MLLNIIDNLPRSSAFDQALALDESLVNPDRQPSTKWRPSVRDYTPMYELLTSIDLGIKRLAQMQSSKDMHLEAWPTPKTAAQVAQARQREVDHSRALSLFQQGQQRYRDMHESN